VIKVKYGSVKSELEDAKQLIYELESEVGTLKSMIEIKDEKLKKLMNSNGEEQRSFEKINEELSNELIKQREQNNVLKNMIENIQNGKRITQERKVCTRPINDIALRLHSKIKQMTECIMELLLKEQLDGPLSCYKEVAGLLAEVDYCFAPSATNDIINKENKDQFKFFDKPRKSRDQRSITIVRTNSTSGGNKGKNKFKLNSTSRSYYNTYDSKGYN